ncbi:MAG: class I mannose-6-phosphate isomerase [Lachnospiraceae bacterium]|nr:class I mannose-6-phosphate isomerase [Lachnospiraceae bacterium]
MIRERIETEETAVLKMMKNRVWRPFVGGRLLDEFQGIYPAEDGHYPEEWVCSTVKATDGTGLSYLADGRTLKEVIGYDLDVLVKVLDSSSRLMIQVHPDRKHAMDYFGSPYGKTEAWYILDTRVIDGVEPYVLLGFREGVTRERWMNLCEAQDVEGMLSCLHRIRVHPGELYFVPGGVPHAMGSGVFFVEIQEPTDITLRVERLSPDGRTLLDKEMHQGIGFSRMFDCFHYEGLSLNEMLKKYRLETSADGKLITKKHTPYFSMELLTVQEQAVVTVEDYAIVLVLDGPDRGSEYFLQESTCFCGGQQLLICRGKSGAEREG